MKKSIAFILTLFYTVIVFASTINWQLYTKDHHYYITLTKTQWRAESGGEIYFGDNDGDGKFSNGILFAYRPPIFRSHGMTTTPDEPTTMDIYVDGKKINSIQFLYLGGKEILIDKRGIKYYKIEKKKKTLFGL